MSRCLRIATLSWFVACATALAGSVEASTEADGTFDDALQRAIGATVFIKVDHAHAGSNLRMSGSGFVIHEDGWIVTNAHVVSNRITVPVGGEVRQAKSKVLRTVVVLNSGTEHEREVQAKVIASDHDIDLALLKVPGPVSPALAFADAATPPAVTDDIWVVGFPYGELLSMERWRDEVVNPVPSVNQGRISAHRRDAEGRLRHLQTDAAINSGNSGGPIIDASGRVVGVVFAKVGAAGVGFGVAAERAVEFVQERGYRISMHPPAISAASRDLTVRLRSSLIDVGTLRGRLTVGGGATPDTTSPFEPTPDGLRASVDLADSAASDAREGLLRTTIELTLPDGSIQKRVFRVRAGNSRTASTAASSGGSGSADQEIPDNTAPTTGLTGGKKFSGATTEAGKPKAKVIIASMSEDDQIRYALTYHERYDHLPMAGQPALARYYDEVFYALYNVSRPLMGMSPYNSSWKDVEKALNGVIVRIDKLESLQTQLQDNDMCRCTLVWRLCSEAHDEDCEKPWVVDDFSDLRRAVE
jgi:S1-C subfamily serine protease